MSAGIVPISGPCSIGVNTLCIPQLFILMFTKLTVLARKSATSVRYFAFWEYSRSSLLSNSVSCSSMQLARFFASTLPEHITVAMPALSPVPLAFEGIMGRR